MLSIAICDDERESLDDIKGRIQQYMISHHPDSAFSVKMFSSGEELFFDAHDHFYDILFLDVIMDRMNGIETAKKLVSLCPSSILIFVSSSAEYAVDAFDVNAFYYLTKPLDGSKFESMFEKCLKKIASLDLSYICLKTSDGFVKVCLKDIVYCMTSGHRIHITLANGETIVCYMKMSEFFDTVSHDKRFLQTHKSFCVNLDYIKFVSRKDSKIGLHQTEIEIPISRDFKTAVMHTYLNYMF